MRTVSIAKDFTRFPAGRYERNGATSGEAFREKFLVPAIRDGEEVVVEFDGTVGYGSSFLEEAFGGLVRRLGKHPDEVLRLVTLVSADSSLVEEVRQYIAEAGSRL